MAQHSFPRKNLVKNSFPVSIISGDPPEVKRFYQQQTKHHLGDSSERISFPIWIADDISRTKYISGIDEVKNVHSSWKPHIKKAIEDINEAAPGIHLYLVQNKSCYHKIAIYGINEKRAYTTTNGDHKVICLYDHWEDKERTSIHELIHALGFGHEHQRLIQILQLL